mgnify:CR=1 FL=1
MKIRESLFTICLFDDFSTKISKSWGLRFSLKASCLKLVSSPCMLVESHPDIIKIIVWMFTPCISGTPWAWLRIMKFCMAACVIYPRNGKLMRNFFSQNRKKKDWAWTARGLENMGFGGNVQGKFWIKSIKYLKITKDVWNDPIIPESFFLMSTMADI